MNNKNLTPIALSILLFGCSDDDTSNKYIQPDIATSVHTSITDSGYTFRDVNGNKTLEPYEDWRLTIEQRTTDLVNRMTIEEKAGMMLIDTMNANENGDPDANADNYINTQKMTRFIFRNTIVSSPENTGDTGMSGPQITPKDAVKYTNAIQKMAAETRLGIPAIFKSNARNHLDPSAKAGINVSAGSFSTWPKEAGLAATRDMELIGEFANIMRDEWTAIGLRSMYGYMMDLATEPRWYRVHETFTEDATLAAEIMVSLITGLQGEQLNHHSVALTIKHFPGGGPQENGADPHYDFGKNQVYPANNFDYHLIPFIAAINAGAASIMPYYGIPVDQDVAPNTVGMSFSKGVVTGLLRDELGFKGYVNTDTGIIGERSWGLEDKTTEEKLIIAIEAGSDVLSGFHDNEEITKLVRENKLSEDRINISVTRLLKEQFQLGLFENPFVDESYAIQTIGKKEYQDKADLAQRKSVVLLQNTLITEQTGNGSKHVLPMVTPTQDKPVKLYTMGIDESIANDAKWGYDVTAGDSVAANTRPSASGADYALIRVRVSNEGSNPELYFGGANPEELDIIDFSNMDTAISWEITPSLTDIQAIMSEIGAEKTILSINFRQPFVLDSSSGLKAAGALLATFGVSDAALMDVLSGEFNPQGKMPFALANSAIAVVNQDSDAPGYDKLDTLFPFGHGLSYSTSNE